MDTTRRFNQRNEPTDPHASGSFPASDALRSVREGLDSAGTYVSSSVESAQRHIAEIRDHGLDRVKDDIVRYTREQPTNALLVAAGLGVLVGVFSELCRR